MFPVSRVAFFVKIQLNVRPLLHMKRKGHSIEKSNDVLSL